MLPLKLVFQSIRFLKYQWIFNNLQGQRFDQLSINAHSSQAAGST